MSRLIAGLIAMLVFVTPAAADDWVAMKLRGTVQQMVNLSWQPLTRNDVVPDDRLIRTGANGHVELVRGAERIDLEPDTQIQISDEARRGKPFTTVTEHFGSVSVEAQVENVQHFAVDTPFLAAVVKGTRFDVTSGATGSSVKVNRGHVQVQNKRDRTQAVIGVGQSATVDLLRTLGLLVVQGRGELPPILNSQGRAIQPEATSGGDTSSLTGSGSDPSGLNLTVGGGLVSLGVGGESGNLVDLGIGGSSGSGGLVNLGIGGGSNGNGLVSLGVGGGSNGGGLANASVGGSGGLVNLNVGSGSSGSTGNSGGGLVNVNVGNSGGTENSGGLVNLNVGGLHLGL